MRLSRQLNDPQPVPRRLGLDKHLVPTTNCRRHVLVVTPVPSWQAGVLSNIVLALLIELLALRIELCRRGERAPDPLVLHAPVRAGGRLARGCNGLKLLRAGSKLSRTPSQYIGRPRITIVQNKEVLP